MADHRRRFDEDFKKSVVDDLVRTQEKLEGGSPYAIVARRYGVHEQMLRNWNKVYGEGRVTPVTSNQYLSADAVAETRRERDRERKREARVQRLSEGNGGHRVFDEAFKREVVADFFDMATTVEGSAVTPVARKHNISTTVLREWIARYGTETPQRGRSRALPSNLEELIAAHRAPAEPEAEPEPEPEAANGREVALIVGTHEPPPGGKLEFVRVEAHHYDDIVAHIQNLEQQLRDAHERLRQHEAEKHVLKQALNIVNDARVTG